MNLAMITVPSTARTRGRRGKAGMRAVPPQCHANDALGTIWCSRYATSLLFIRSLVPPWRCGVVAFRFTAKHETTTRTTPNLGSIGESGVGRALVCGEALTDAVVCEGARRVSGGVCLVADRSDSGFHSRAGLSRRRDSRAAGHRAGASTCAIGCDGGVPVAGGSGCRKAAVLGRGVADRCDLGAGIRGVDVAGLAVVAQLIRHKPQQIEQFLVKTACIGPMIGGIPRLAAAI
jgi:hypothetical protein